MKDQGKGAVTEVVEGREGGKEEEKEEVVVKEIIVPSTVKAVSEKTFDDIAEALTSAF